MSVFKINLEYNYISCRIFIYQIHYNFNECIRKGSLKSESTEGFFYISQKYSKSQSWTITSCTWQYLRCLVLNQIRIPKYHEPNLTGINVKMCVQPLWWPRSHLCTFFTSESLRLFYSFIYFHCIIFSLSHRFSELI